jgi:hypothetical protein
MNFRRGENHLKEHTVSKKRIAVVVLTSAVIAICTATAASAAELPTTSGAAVTTMSVASPDDNGPVDGGTDW